MADRGTVARAAGVASLLGAVAGFVDAQTFLHDRLFAANVTGNVVFTGLGLAGVAHGGNGGVSPLLPIAAFFAGAMLAGLLEAAPRWTPFALEIVVLGIAAFVAVPGVELAVIAVAMGLQNGAIGDFGGVRANTSFVTGDIQKTAMAVGRLIARRAEDRDVETIAVVLPILAAYVAAAYVGARFAAHAQHAVLFALPLLAVVAFVRGRTAESRQASG